MVPEADSKAEAWVSAMAAAVTLADLAKVRADCATDYGSTKDVPQAVRAAFSARKSAIESAVEVVEGEPA